MKDGALDESQLTLICYPQLCGDTAHELMPTGGPGTSDGCANRKRPGDIIANIEWYCRESAVSEIT